MTTETVADDVLEQLQPSAGEVVHLSCCDDIDWLLCGRRLRPGGVGMLPAATPLDCAPCIEADEDRTCPVNGTCPHAAEADS